MTYTDTMSSYMTERNWITDLLQILGTSLESFKEIADVKHEVNKGFSFKVGSDRINVTVADIPYPPIRPEFFMAEVSLSKTGPYVIEGLKIPFTEKAHGTTNVRMWGYEQETIKYRRSFVEHLAETLTKLAFSEEHNALFYQAVFDASDAVDQAAPFSLDALRSDTKPAVAPSGP